MTDEQNKNVVTVKTFSDVMHWFGPLEKGWSLLDRVRLTLIDGSR